MYYIIGACQWKTRNNHLFQFSNIKKPSLINKKKMKTTESNLINNSSLRMIANTWTWEHASLIACIESIWAIDFAHWENIYTRQNNRQMILELVLIFFHVFVSASLDVIGIVVCLTTQFTSKEIDFDSTRNAMVSFKWIRSVDWNSLAHWFNLKNQN